MSAAAAAPAAAPAGHFLQRVHLTMDEEKLVGLTQEDMVIINMYRVLDSCTREMFFYLAKNCDEHQASLYWADVYNGSIITTAQIKCIYDLSVNERELLYYVHCMVDLGERGGWYDHLFRAYWLKQWYKNIKRQNEQNEQNENEL